MMWAQNKPRGVLVSAVTPLLRTGSGRQQSLRVNSILMSRFLGAKITSLVVWNCMHLELTCTWGL